MKSGLKRIYPSRKDFDHHKSFGTLGLPTGLPTTFDVDAGLWVPNQLVPMNYPGIPPVPALFEGCTDYAQTDLCMDEDGLQYSPMALELLTHANANGGADIRVSLKAAITVFGRSAYFNIRPSYPLDFFDAVRLAMYAAQPEKRAVSVGSIWYPQWEVIGSDGILPMPPELHLNGPWHNWVVCGWTTINGVLYLKGKSWQGEAYGDHGFHYISREVFNSIMSVYGTGAFTISKTTPGQIFTVDMTVLQSIVAFIRQLFHV